MQVVVISHSDYTLIVGTLLTAKSTEEKDSSGFSIPKIKSLSLFVFVLAFLPNPQDEFLFLHLNIIRASIHHTTPHRVLSSFISLEKA